MFFHGKEPNSQIPTAGKTKMRADAWQAIFTGGTFATALVASWIGLRQLSQFRERQKQLSRPYVVVDFYFRQTLICISVENIGHSPAANIKIIFEPELQTTRPEIVKDNIKAIARTIPMMAPKRKIVWLLDTSASAFNHPDLVPHTYKATVSYSELPEARKRSQWRKSKEPFHYTDPVQYLDLQQYEGALMQDTSS